MNLSDFYSAITDVVSLENDKSSQLFLYEIKKIMEDLTSDKLLNMTRMSILFEGFYKHLNNEHSLKSKLTSIRINRWKNHFGAPTITFLLSYQTQIDETTKEFNLASEFAQQNAIDRPWLVSPHTETSADKTNEVLINENSPFDVQMPANKERTGFFTKTHNPFGGFTTTPCDPISEKFIKHARESVNKNGKVLEIGAAFGAATLAALATGATVFCNDISAENLAVVRNRFQEASPGLINSVTGDNNKLVLVPGEFPSELMGLPEQFFDAILICRVLHFFPGKKIDDSLQMMSKLLTPGGKLYIVCETPYLKNWQSFIPEFNKRIAFGNEWPGEITNPAEFESSGRAASLPKFVHWITKEVLERSLHRANLSVEHVDYINRKGQFPDDLLLDGKESVGAIGFKT